MLWWILFAFGWFVAAFWAVGAYRILRFVRDGKIDVRAVGRSAVLARVLRRGCEQA